MTFEKNSTSSGPEQLRRVRVSGRVQGVFFRASTAEQARALGLAGSARNLADGSVEVLLRGSSPAIEQMLAWLQRGPPLARVDRVEVDQPSVASVPTAGFETG